MAKERKIEVEYSLVNKTFNAGIKQINSEVTTLNKEFKLQKEQMKNVADESEKFEASIGKLNKEYDLAEQKTNQTRVALENMHEIFGENSEAARVWGDKLLDAERNQEYLKNQITETTISLTKYVQEEQRKADAILEANKAVEESTEVETEHERALRESIAASERRKAVLGDLSDEHDTLSSNTEKLTAQYELEKTKLGENASQIAKVRLEKQHLADQTLATANEISNLEKQLELTEEEYGKNSKEANELETQLLETKRANEEFTQSLREKEKYLGIGKEAIQQYGEKLKSVGDSMSKYVTLPLVAGAGLAIKAASDWESSFADVRKTVDGTDVELAAIEEGLRSMSAIMPTSANELAEIAANAGQLGIETPAVLKFTETMAKLAETTDMTADSASTAFAQFANVMGTTSDEYERIGSVIVELGNNMAATEPEIMEMSQRMAAQSKIIGLNEQQVMALAATLASVDMNAEAGGSAMTRVFQKLDTSVKGSTEELGGFAKIAGQTAEEFSETWSKDPQKAITAFMDGLGKIQEGGGDTAGILKDLGITSVNEIGALQSLALASDLLGESFLMAGEAYEDGLGENSALAQEAAVRFETFASKMEMLRYKLNDVMIDVGRPLVDAVSAGLEALEPFLNMIADLAQRFADADPSMQQMILTIVGIVAALGPLLSILGTLMTTMTFIFSWPGLIIVGLIALVAAVIIYWDEITAKFQSSWEEWVAIFTAIGEFFGAIWSNIYNTVAGWVGGIATWVSEKWNAITNYTSDLAQNVTRWFTNIYDNAKRIWTNIGNWIDEKITWAKEKVKGAIEAIKGFLNFEWKWPSIPIPVFTFSGSVNPLDWGDKSKRPNIGVNWKYLAKGGIFDQATLFPSGHVVGEAGPEAVIPLNKNVLCAIGEGIVRATEGMQRLMGNNQSNVVVIGDIELVVGTRTMAKMLINDIEYEKEVKVKKENLRKGRK